MPPKESEAESSDESTVAETEDIAKAMKESSHVWMKIAAKYAGKEYLENIISILLFYFFSTKNYFFNKFSNSFYLNNMKKSLG